LTREQVAERYPEQIERLKNGEDIPLGGGESYAAFSARIDAALLALRAQLQPGDHALVVCHGGVIATALAGALGLRRAGHWALARVANTSITGLSFSSSSSSSQPRLHVFNDTLHLLALGSWPLHSDTQGVVGLVCDTLDGDCFGSFAAQYDAGELLGALGAQASRAAWVEALSARLLELHERHPDGRVALSAHAGSIQAWAEQALWRDGPGIGALAPPGAGSISHVGRVGERSLLLDYGISVLPAR
jgi:broad specificity phosphatase PhoE